MKTFVQWAKEVKKEEFQVDENKIRTGLRPYYPSGYVRHEYPDAYYYSHSATAPLDLQNAKSGAFKDKAPTDEAP
jgi:hypothetical protein